MHDALAGTRALLLDMDGVLVARGRPIPGAPGAIARLRAAGIPFRVITNISLSSRSSLSRRLASGGIDIPAEQIVTALSAAVEEVAAAGSGQAVYLLGSAEAPAEFAGADVRLLTDADVDRGASADVVVIGDSEDRLSYENLNRAFRLLRRGARFVAMHRNPWWFTPAGPTLDSGAFVAGLEFATGRRATVAGKPSPAVFRAALHELATNAAAGARLLRRDVAMVGDDLRADLAPARRLGLRTVLVLTGRHGEEELATSRRGGRARILPDAVAPSIVEVAGAFAIPVSAEAAHGVTGARAETRE